MNKRYLTELEEIFNGDAQTGMEGSGHCPSPARIQAAMQRGRYMRAVAYSVALKRLAFWVVALFNRLPLASRFIPAHFSLRSQSPHRHPVDCNRVEKIANYECYQKR